MNRSNVGTKDDPVCYAWKGAKMIDEQPLVSVVIPTYNGCSFLGETIESVLAQSYTRFEIIVVDDGSTDSTASLLSDYGDRVRTVTTHNVGTAGARNAGIRASRGEIVAFLDHDDLWTREKLAKQVKLMRADPRVGMTYGGMRFFDNSSGRVTSEHLAARNLTVHDLLAHTIISLQTAVIRRDVFDQVGDFDIRLQGTDDWDLTIRIANEFVIRGIPDVLVNIRCHPENQSNDTDKMIVNSWRVLAKHRALHGDCRECRQAMATSARIIREDHYQRLIRSARTAIAARDFGTGTARYVRALTKNPQALGRVPVRISQRLFGFPRIPSAPVINKQITDVSTTPD